MGGNCMVEKYLWNVKVLWYYTQRNNIQINMLWLSKVILQASWKSQLIWYKYNYDVLSLVSQDFKAL